MTAAVSGSGPKGARPAMLAGGARIDLTRARKVYAAPAAAAIFARHEGAAAALGLRAWRVYHIGNLAEARGADKDLSALARALIDLMTAGELVLTLKIVEGRGYYLCKEVKR